MHTAISEAQALLKAYRHPEAEAVLRSALLESPHDPDLHAELGRILCFTQREFEAVPHYEQSVGSSAQAGLGQTLANYFACRAEMASRHNVDDREAEALSRRVSEKPEKVGIKISACLIVKNEEKHLDRCLSSLKGVVDEIVVVDTGSTDRTIEIAQKYGAKIGHFEWVNDFSAARNYSLSLASGDWALWIDADEELHTESSGAFVEAVMRPQFGGYYIRIVNFLDPANPASQYVHTPLRLFRLIPEITFEGSIHEQVLQCFDRHGLVTATLQNALLHHYGYQANDIQEKGKIERTVSMLEKELERHPEDAFQWFNLANVLSVARRWEESEKAARKALEFVTDRSPFIATTYQLLTSALIMLGRPAEAVEFCREQLGSIHWTVANQFDFAHALLKAELPHEALEAIDRCLEMPWPTELAGDYGIKTHKSLVMKAQILVALGRYEEALALTDQAMAVDSTFAHTHLARGKALVGLGRHGEAGPHFGRASAGYGMEDCMILAAQAYENSGQVDLAATAWHSAWTNKPERTEVATAWLLAVEKGGDPARMVSAYEEADEAGLQSPALKQNWGRALAALGQNQEAIRRMKEAVELDPNSANAWFNFGDLCYKMGGHQEAAECYQAGLRLEPSHDEAWFVLGNCFAMLGSAEGAKLAYRQALTLNPRHEGANHNLQLVAA